MADDEQVIEPVSGAVEETTPGIGFLEKVQHWFHVSMFAPQWVQARWRTPQVGYVAALVLQLVAVICMLLLRQLFPFFTFFGSFSILAMLIVALVWGARPSLLSALFGTILVNYFILTPMFTWKVNNLQQVVETFVFFLVGSVISLLTSRTEFAREQTEALVIQLQNEKQALSAAQQEAANRARELETILETMTDGLAVYDQHGNIRYANPAVRELFTLDSQPGFTSRPMHERLSAMAQSHYDGTPLAPQEWPHTRILQGKVLKGETAAEMLVRKLNGEDIYLSVSGAPIYDANGTLTGAVLITRDVTAQIQLQQRLSDAEQEALMRARQLEATFNGITDQVLVYNHEGKLVLTNRATQQFNTSTRRLDYYTIPIDQRLTR